VCDKQIQSVAAAAAAAATDAEDDGMAQSLPVEAYHDEDRGAVGGAVGEEVLYPLHTDVSHEVLFHNAVILSKSLLTFYQSCQLYHKPTLSFVF